MQKLLKLIILKYQTPFEINFNKNKVIDDGFKKAFEELISLIVNSSEIKKKLKNN